MDNLFAVVASYYFDVLPEKEAIENGNRILSLHRTEAEAKKHAEAIREMLRDNADMYHEKLRYNFAK